MTKYIVKFQNQDCWLANWEGDPGRTLVMSSAKVFKNEFQADLAIKMAFKMNPHRKMSLKSMPNVPKLPGRPVMGSGEESIDG